MGIGHTLGKLLGLRYGDLHVGPWFCGGVRGADHLLALRRGEHVNSFTGMGEYYVHPFYF